MDEDEGNGGLHPGWITFLAAFLAISFTTGLLAIYGMNLPFVLDPYQTGFVRVRLAALGSAFLLDSSLVVLVTPVMALEIAPLALAIHVVLISALYALAIERCHRGSLTARLLLLTGLAFALVTPLPGVYGYPNPFPHVITLWPQNLIPIILFFGHPLIRYTFPVAAYSLPLAALAWKRDFRRDPGISRRGPAVYPAYLLPTTLFGGMLLVILGDLTLQLIGLILNWTLMVVGLLLWAFYYRPALDRICVLDEKTWLERLLYSWKDPASTFVLLIIFVLLLTALEPVDEFVESNASGHHLQHVLLFLLGLVQSGIVYQQVRTFRRKRNVFGSIARFVYTGNVLVNRGGIAGILISTSFLAWWHIPYFWDLALMDDTIHVIEHIFVLAAGGAVSFSLPLIRPAAKYAFLVAAMIPMSLLSLALWFAGTPVYSTYPLEQLSDMGMYHFLLGMPLMIYALGATAFAVLKGQRTSAGVGGVWKA